MSSYFKQVPDFEYVSRLPDAGISDYIKVKNLFKKGYLREDIFQDTTVFTKYEIKGDDRPDNVAFELYEDDTLDWLILICNNIQNIHTEWPLSQIDFDEYLLEKYKTFDAVYNEVHHYETTELKNSNGVVIVPAGLQVESTFSIKYFDQSQEQYFTQSPIKTITNFDYENEIENNKRNIFTLKLDYVSLVKDDIESMMTYKKGSTQYVNRTLKRGDNINLYS